ncbi:MAG TPA: hypothetical protein PK295_03605 [Candidatus Magasanikbacteria bacterium]|nr:hypothetical protein [Candidatus Magasanikbacteria bacterium]
MSTFFWALFGLVIGFFVVMSVRFRKTKLLSNFKYQPDEKQLFEEKPIKLEYGTDRPNRTVGITAGGGISVTSRSARRTRILRPWIRVTNKNIIIVQKKEEKPDGPIYAVLWYGSASGDSAVSSWWKTGYVTVPITVSEIRAVAQEDGVYMIEIPLPSLLPLPGMENMQQTANIWTSQLSQYEKALDIKIPVKSEN